LVFYLTVLGGT